MANTENTVDENTTLGGGCFWCLEAVFQELEGVLDIKSGYAGGNVDNPTYEEVSNGRTGHAEVVQVRFDPRVISFKEILRVFFGIHDPTTLNRQGADKGARYRSVILYSDPEQKADAEAVMAELAEAGIWTDPIVTEVAPLTAFWEAEDYHQDYYNRYADQPYCRAVIDPKLAKFRRENQARLARRKPA